ncbi:DUF2461 domain-containing protein [Mucilaginibacter sp.]|uniref:DUF2461 domain-containing protein n=1 Tax=Mucilaginibacter sp. TaxID=1882438 RepID=UPI00284C28DE|nr:DUF2461 domain-containing protein [Mucilaginibacter sp.]MDR3693877.1 DUF2461 domain-containing protein [Mucilaginibacter sp.]
MAAAIIKKDSLDFLTDLGKNNNREWFNLHMGRYLDARHNIIDFADALLAEMNSHDRIETPSGKKSLFRIYKDVRFSKDKTPYNSHWSGSFKRAGKALRGGYYFRIEPGNSALVGGFWGPGPDDMKRIRQDICANYPDWNNLLGNQTLVQTFGNLYGEQLGTAPRGYQKGHPAIDLLRYKQYMLKHAFSDEEVLSPGFIFKVDDVFKKMRPFLDFMSEILTTDANGVSLLD